MKIILLSGNPNTGKTSTLNLVYDELISLGGTILTAKSKLGGNQNDFECLLKFNSKVVAIFSMGDYKYICYEAVAKYSNCDYLVLAYSDKFKNSMSDFLEKLQHHKVVKKSIASEASDFHSCNTTDMKNIIDCINQ